MAPRVRHGHGKRGATTPTYRAWIHAKQRCYNPKNRYFPIYGGRGIVMCDVWRRDFAAFLRDMGERPSKAHSLDRYPDQSGPYAPDNCRWATELEQHNNVRTNRLITYQGETRTAAEWARVKGLGYTTLIVRLDRGWTTEDALNVPPQPGRPLLAEARGHRITYTHNDPIPKTNWINRASLPVP